MPVTPFHLGPGLLAKAAIPGAFSFLAFACTQVAIDLESLYNLLSHRWPVHRFFHSIPGSIIAGALVAVVLSVAARRVAAVRRSARSDSGEWTRVGLFVGGLVGGVSHSLLDAIMHSDVRSLYPFGEVSPLYGTVGFTGLHVGCGIAAVIGVIALGVRFHHERV